MIRTLTATRYVTPLREGGSLPGIVEANDDGLYVLKFRGAGQGRKALIAELLGGELARAAGLNVPTLALMELDPALGRNEPDSEIRELLKSSVGLNLALDYLPGSVTFDPVAGPAPDELIASRIVWLDALITNVDRTPKNPNLLCWHRDLWLIDHGASLYFHHAWGDLAARAQDAFTMVKDHVLLPWASRVSDVNAELRARLSVDVVREIVETIPASWLEGESRFPTVEEHRAAYREYLLARLSSSNVFVEEAVRARAQLV